MIKYLRIAALACLFPALANAGIERTPVKTSSFAATTASRYVYHTASVGVLNGSSVSPFYVYPMKCGARLVDVLVYQRTAGGGGTSWGLDIRNVSGTSLLTTTGVITLASGAGTVTDAKGELSLPNGWTRPALKTDSTVDVAKGDLLYVYTTEVGSFSTHPTAVVTFVFDPKC